MILTVEATIDESGHIHLIEPLEIKGTHRVLVTILDEPPSEIFETALLSQSSLSTDWSTSEEDDAWAHLQ